MNHSPKVLNIPSNLRSEKKRQAFMLRNDSDTKSIFNPIGDFLQLVGLNVPFKRKLKVFNAPSSVNASESRKIDLPDLYESSLEKEHIELSQFSFVEVDPEDLGIGHDFESVDLKNPTWCDFCGGFIWGIYKAQNCNHCRYCNYTCHQRCKELVTLNCKPTTSIANEENDDVSANSETSFLSVDENCQEHDAVPQGLQDHIATYNASVASGNEVSLSADGKYSGIVRVHMNLCRPINVVSGSRPLSIYDIIYKETDDSMDRKTLTSFYLPPDTIKSLHITNETTAQEVISALLKKYNIIDNPHKFVLYEKYFESEDSMRVKLRRIHETERPLQLILMWTVKCANNRHLVLQENDTGDIPWEAFSLPELNNFLRILDREEEEYVSQVRFKYQMLEAKLREEMEAYSASDRKNASPPRKQLSPAAGAHFDNLDIDGTSTKWSFNEMVRTCADLKLDWSRHAPSNSDSAPAAAVHSNLGTEHGGPAHRSRTMPATLSHATPVEPMGYSMKVSKTNHLLDVT